ncbi:MAG: hypothetical protein AAGI08_16285 [Bacteroidota bacterium]
MRALSLLLFTVLLAPHATGQATDVLGSVQFETSPASPEAMEAFEQGVLLLHNFEFRDAQAAFSQARELDPDFAMAYWGGAMANNMPVWNTQDLDAARAILAEAPPAPTEREAAYLDAVRQLFGEGDKKERDRRYAEAMRALHEAYPEDDEAQAFYALALLGTEGGTRNFRTYMRAGALALDLFERNPKHPGAAHYVIHSFDDPIHAPLGLEAAHAYAVIASDAPHALHMPSHIFMALGMWEESAASNEASAAAGLRRDSGWHHATYWLAYTYTQQGRLDDALAQIEQMVARTEADPDSRMNRHHLALMQASYLVESGEWWIPLHPSLDEIDDLRMTTQAQVHFARGMKALDAGRLAAADSHITHIEQLAEEGTVRYGSDRGLTRVTAMVLDAQRHRAAGDTLAAIELAGQAVEVYESLAFEFGPPVPVKPAHELYADLLLEAGRSEEAAEAYRVSLERMPKRRLSQINAPATDAP